MRGHSFFNYLAKYISKESYYIPAGYIDEGGGRWWGKCNIAAIPYVPMVEKSCELETIKEEKQIIRTLYKLRQKRAQAAVDLRDGLKPGQASLRKARKLPRYGKITLLGDPEFVLDAIKRMIHPRINKKARARIFASRE